MGERWEPFRAYNLDRARTPSVQAALGALMEQFGLPRDPAGGARPDRRPDDADLGTPRPRDAARVAEAASARYGWPLHVIEDAPTTRRSSSPRRSCERCARDRDGRRHDHRRRSTVDALRVRLRGARCCARGRGLRRRRRGSGTAWSRRRRRWSSSRPGAADVAAAVRFAREHGLALSVRGGGHNIAGTAIADGGLTLDMSRLRGVVVDPEARTAHGPGRVPAGDVDRATQRHGLATPLGFISEVGVAGLTLGGGLGYLTRRFGWTVDNLLEVEIVTADGADPPRQPRRERRPVLGDPRRRRQPRRRHPFTFRLHEVGPTVYGGLIAWPFERADEILRGLPGAHRRGAPRAGRVADPAPRPAGAVRARRVARRADLRHGRLLQRRPRGVDEALAPIRALGDPVFDLLGEQPYTEVQSYLDETEPKGMHYYWKTEYLAELSDDAARRPARDLFAGCPVPDGELGILHLGGALNEHADDDGAVGNRDARYVVGVKGMWEPGEPRRGRVPAVGPRRVGARSGPFSTGGTYINFQTADEGDDRVRATYGANYDRLVEVKRALRPGQPVPLQPQRRAATRGGILIVIQVAPAGYPRCRRSTYSLAGAC